MPNTMLVYLSKSPDMAMAMSPNRAMTCGFTDLNRREERGEWSGMREIDDERNGRKKRQVMR